MSLLEDFEKWWEEYVVKPWNQFWASLLPPPPSAPTAPPPPAPSMAAPTTLSATISPSSPTTQDRILVYGVLSESDKPKLIANAPIKLTLDGTFLTQVTTDSQGNWRYTFGPENEGSHIIKASFEGNQSFQPSETSVPFTVKAYQTAPPLKATVTLKVSPTQGNPLTYFTFQGVAQDQNGSPLSGYLIEGFYQGQGYNKVVFTAKTNTDGSYSATVGGFSPGTYNVYAAVVTDFGPGGQTNPIIAGVSSPVSFTVTATTLSCSPSSYQVLHEPDGSVVVTVTSGAVSGGTLPYHIKFYWSDGVVDETDSGTDSRTFPPGASIATPTKYTVTSADGQTCSSTLNAPPPSQPKALKISTDKSSYSGEDLITFLGQATPPPPPGYNAFLMLINPNGTTVFVQSINVDTTTGRFSTSVRAGGIPANWPMGTYKVHVTLPGYPAADTTFYYTP